MIYILQNKTKNAIDQATDYIVTNSDKISNSFHGMALTACALQKAGKTDEARQLYQKLRESATEGKYKKTIQSKHSTVLLEGMVLVRLHWPIVYQIWWPNGCGNKLVIQGSWVRVPLWTGIFLFSLSFSLFAARVSPCKWNQSWHTPSQYPVLDKGSLLKIWLPSPVVWNG